MISRNLGAFSFAALLLILPPLRADQPREIGVKVLADAECRRETAWKEASESLIRLTSVQFEKSFGIKLVPRQWEEWDSPSAPALLELLADDLDNRVDRGGAEILLAFTAKKNPVDPASGFSLFKEAVVVVRTGGSGPAAHRILMHEVAHLFGAVHVDDPESVMDLFGRGASLDPLNSGIVSLNRKRSFSGGAFPTPRENWPEVSAIYTRIARSLQAARLKKEMEKAGAPGAGAELRQRSALPSWQNDFRRLDDTHLLLAQIHIEEKRYDLALSECSQALEFNPENFETLNLMGIALRRKGQIAEAIQKYREVLNLRPSYARAHFNMGIAHAKAGDLDRAVAAYLRALELKPAFAEARSNLGEVYLRLGKSEEAFTELRRAVADAPRFALAHANLAEACFRRQEYAQALSEAELAISLDPRLVGGYIVKGNLLRRQGQLAEAAQEYRRALAADPESDKAFFNLGICHLDLEEIAAARECFARSVQINGAFAEARAELGYCLVREHKPDEAIRELTAAQRLGYQSAKTHLNLSSALLEKGRLEEAIAAARQALARDAELALAYNNLGIAYAGRGMTRDALENFQQCVRIDPRCQNAYLNMGNLYLQVEMIDQALDCYLRGAAISAGDGTIHNNIAVIYFRRGEYVRAMEHVRLAEERGLRVNPAFIAELRRRIQEGR